ncbi:protein MICRORCHIDIA 6 isoform X1 [Carica papaya]|uniref:protein MICRORCHIDIA 6 isoform X1 n=1 Tax=Carica papaya TaxID=3649 RepID=UPI000B8CB826|nr:protein MICRORCHIDIA 6 isoform X1 [Carica papaya]XP_021891958.1 protein MICRORCHIDIA 6 isoform X1 [Carica papaya]XP_021891959.1 protein MICRORCHIDIA 6 isoform X1 [Carica papaya]
MDAIDIHNRARVEVSNLKDERSDFDLGTTKKKESQKFQKDRHQNSKNTGEEYGKNRTSIAPSTRGSNLNMLDKGGSPTSESSLTSSPVVGPAPLCRQFWNAGNYKLFQDQSKKFSYLKRGSSYLHVHPMFLHSNATSHKWVFGAFAELLDNAIDEQIENGATFVSVDRIFNPRDGSHALVIQDDGGGMDPNAIRHCMSFGFSDKQKEHAIGKYGNGFKTGSMRLGADVIVFSRHSKTRMLTQSVGLLSYTFLRQLDYDRIVLPAVDFKFSSSTGAFIPIRDHGEEHFSSNLFMLLKWSPFATEEQMLKQFDDIGPHGTKIIIYNLWMNDNGEMELDFDSDPEDIHITGDPRLLVSQRIDQHIANRYQYSLRAYLSILYLRLPTHFSIILRGQLIQHHNIADDLKLHEFILYEPQASGTEEAKVVTTIGFLKEAPHVNIHGFCIYHQNRLILPFWPAVKNASGSQGRGVVGVLEANFIQPTHNKQDFERTSLFQKLETRLKQMTAEFWKLYCGQIGYQPVVKVSPRVAHSTEPLSLNLARPVPDPGLTTPVLSGRKRRSPDSHSNNLHQGFDGKMQHDSQVQVEHAGTESCSTGSGKHEKEQPNDIVKNQSHDQERINHLLQARKELQSQILGWERQEPELNLKVQQLRHELEEVRRLYETLMAESEAMVSVKEERGL